MIIVDDIKKFDITIFIRYNGWYYFNGLTPNFLDNDMLYNHKVYLNHMRKEGITLKYRRYDI